MLVCGMAIPVPTLDLRRFPLFSLISDVSNQALLDRHLVMSCEAEQLLAMEQDWGESLFLVLHGLAKVRAFNGDGTGWLFLCWERATCLVKSLCWMDKSVQRMWWLSPPWSWSS